MADYGNPIAYLALEEGTPVYDSGGERFGTVEHVLADADVDIFDGLVIDTRGGSAAARDAGRFRFADATEVAALYEQGVVLGLDAQGAAALPEPDENAATMRVDPDDTAPTSTGDKLRRAWDYLSGKY